MTLLGDFDQSEGTIRDFIAMAMKEDGDQEENADSPEYKVDSVVEDCTKYNKMALVPYMPIWPEQKQQLIPIYSIKVRIHLDILVNGSEWYSLTYCFLQFCSTLNMSY